ncbi:MAG TPA: LuxR C-terminal-related transcriptional regulator [Caulobacteraceae bacterium]|jgi:FixJ family two-component response regulator|nr:LuxR C-terminal-related transcriptional regulator [Caulobacteraceae bacterium]
MPDRSRVYLIARSGDQRRNRLRVLEDAGYEAKGFASARAFIEFAPVIAAGCVVEIRSPEFDHPFEPGDLSAQRNDLPVIVMSPSEGNVTLAVSSIKAGASNFLETGCDDARLLEAVAEAIDGLDRSGRRDNEAALSTVRIAEMSGREREVLERLMVGGTNKTIAKELGISPRTVEIHRAHVMDRLGAHSLPEAVRMALAAGFSAA